MADLNVPNRTFYNGDNLDFLRALNNECVNRIMLCKPCNGYKSDRRTLRGLHADNKKEKWMHDESAARIAQSRAKDKAEAVRQEMTQGG